MRPGKLLLLIALGLIHQLSLSAAPPAMAAFIKDGQVYIANGDGSAMSRISPGAERKAMPRWSPDGKRVVYLDTGASRESMGSLVVVDTRGVVLGTFSVAKVAADGTRIDGMRFVEKIGWMDDSHVFAEGSVNPHAEEYRKIDVTSGKVGGFGGTGFATCTRTGLVAFWLPVFPPSTAMTLQLSSGDAPIFTFPDWNALPTISVDLAGDRQGESLVFVDPREPARFVIVAGGRVHRVVPIPGTGVTPTIKSIARGFLIGSEGKLFYDLGTSRIVPTPADIFAATRKEAAERQRMAATLDAIDVDFRKGNE